MNAISTVLMALGTCRSRLMRKSLIGAERSRRASLVNSRLTSEYGRKVWSGANDPLDTLIETILSQNTSDVNSGRAFEALRKRYPAWSEALAADQAEIAQTIRSGGLAEVKARRIKQVLTLLAEERGDLSLDFLDDMDASEAERWLTRMEGIGPKTAAIVLLFSLGKPAFPVDTHVFRVSRRIGLTSKTSSREVVQSELERIVNPGEYYNMHINLIEHGRSKCRARRPRCSGCVISDVCEHFNQVMKGQP